MKEQDLDVSVVMSKSIKALLGIYRECNCPFPSLCDAAMVSSDHKIVCVDSTKPCKWRPSDGVTTPAQGGNRT